MLAILMLWGCTAGQEPAESPYDFVGTWRVATFSSGTDCNFPQLEDYGAPFVRIDVLSGAGEDVVGVYPCSSETTCDLAFSDFDLAPVDATSASGLTTGLDWRSGFCELWWIRAELVAEGGGVVVTSRNEANADALPADTYSACADLQEGYAGAFECLRTESLVLEPM